MSEEQLIERCARHAHNIFAGYCRALGDYSIKEWADAEAWQRESTIEMVKAVLAGNHTPSAEHDRWLADKKEKGYVYGTEKNDDPSAGPLTNPNIMPYDELPFSARMKDTLLMVVAAGVATHNGLTVAREFKLSFA